MRALELSSADAGTRVSDPKSFSTVASRLWNFSTDIHVNDMFGDVLVRNSNVCAGCCSITNFGFQGQLDAFALRTHQNIRADNAELYILTLPQKGSNAISQNGRHERIDHHQFILTRANAPYRMAANFGEDLEHNSLHLLFPASIARQIYPDVDDLLCRPFQLRAGKARLGRDIIVSLANEGPHLSSLSNETFAVLAVQTIIESAAAGLEEEDPPGRHPKAQLLLSYIRQHRSDPDLSVAKASRALGISASNVHNILGTCGTTFQKTVWDERFAGAYRQLSDERFSDRTIASIAFSEGFKSNAHFTRAFFRKYGVLPKALRRQALIVPQ